MVQVQVTPRSKPRRKIITSRRFQSLLFVVLVTCIIVVTRPENFSAYYLLGETSTALALVKPTEYQEEAVEVTPSHETKEIDNTELIQRPNESEPTKTPTQPPNVAILPKIAVSKELYPGPPKKISPLIFDADGVPNVVHGCGNLTETNYKIQIHVHCLSNNNNNNNNNNCRPSFWQQLQRANMTGSTSDLPLYIHTTNENMAIDSLLNEWKYGPMHVRKGNTTDWWDTLAVEAQQAGNNTLLICLSDQINLSSLYFQYLQKVLYQYTRQPRCRDASLFGMSLYPVGYKALGKSQKNHRTYLSGHAAENAVAYWSDQFFSFYKFVKLRRKIAVSSPFLSHVTSSPTKKQQLAEYMFGRGLVILYPAIQLASSNLSKPLLSKWPNDLFLAPYGDLGVLDNQLKLSTKEILLATGTKFLNSVSQQCDGCQELLEAWSRPGWIIPSMWKHDNPLLCVADAYSSTALMSLRSHPHKSITTRYLLFEPQFGTNNQIHAIMEAYYWAKALGRQLVVPPILTPRVSAYMDDTTNRTHWIEFSKFYRLLPLDSTKLFGSDFQAFPGHDLPPISFTEFEKLNLQPWRFLRLTRHTPFDPSTRLISQTLGLPTDDEIVSLKHLFHKAVGVNRVQHLLGGCEDQVLAVDNLYFAALKEASPRKLMSTTLALTTSVQAHVKSIQQLLHAELGSANYSCYHVRQGDFAEMCETIEQPSTVGTREVSSWLRKSAQDFQCFVGNDELKAQLLADPRPALILSDNPGALQDAIASSSTKTVTSHWVYNMTKTKSRMTGSELSILSLIVDQTLCAKADVAMLNFFSTVSQRIANLRNEKGVEYWKISNR